MASSVTSLTSGSTLDTQSIKDALPDDVVLSAEEEQAINDIAAAENLEAIVEAQAKVIDATAPDAPVVALTKEANSGDTKDALTNETNPTFRIEFDTTANDGTAVVAGDTLQITSSGKREPDYIIQKDDIKNLTGYFDPLWS